MTSPTATAIISTTATLGGRAARAGAGAITTRGVLYSSTNSNPTLAGVGSGVTKVDDSAGGTGTFTENVTGLTPGTTYYYVAFATNSSGTAYTSPVLSFTTLPAGGYYEVTTNADTNNAVDFGHDGTQADPFLAPTLRSAINAAELATGPVTIIFANSLSGATITLNSVLTISQSVTISGLGAANLAISGNHATEVFDVASGVTASIAYLTIENGSAGDGGGIDNNGTLTLSNSTLAGNSASSGGGILNYGTLTLSNSTLSGNGASYYGGGILNYGTLMLSNSTFSGNGASYYGGGILNYGTLMLSNSTFSGNSASYTGGGILNGGTLTLQNTIVAGNTAGFGGSDISGTVNSLGNNLIGQTDGSSGWIVSGPSADLTGTSGSLLDPKLDPLGLQNNGGPTQTIALETDSPAIDAGARWFSPP